MTTDNNYLTNNLNASQFIVGQHQANQLGKNIDTSSNKAIDDAAIEFEAIFITQMLNTMFEGIETDPLFGGGNAENIYNTMLREQYAESLAQKGDLGIADSVRSELIKLQEAQSHEGK